MCVICVSSWDRQCRGEIWSQTTSYLPKLTLSCWMGGLNKIKVKTWLKLSKLSCAYYVILKCCSFSMAQQLSPILVVELHFYWACGSYSVLKSILPFGDAPQKGWGKTLCGFFLNKPSLSFIILSWLVYFSVIYRDLIKSSSIFYVSKFPIDYSKQHVVKSIFMASLIENVRPLQKKPTLPT